MKTLKTISKLLIVSLSVFALSCSSDSSSGSGGSGGPSNGTYIKAKVDGTVKQTYYVSSTVSAGVAVTTGTGTGRVIEISGANDLTGTNTFSILLIGIDATGTYTINKDSDSVLTYQETAGEKSWDTSNCDSATGTITITTLNDTKIEGTLSFTGKIDENCSDTKTITAGSFRGVFSH